MSCEGPICRISTEVTTPLVTVIWISSEAEQSLI